MHHLCTLLLLACLAAGAERPYGADAWSASFAKEAGGDYANALNALQQLRQGRSDSYLLALRIGWLQYRNGRLEDAIASYGEAIRLAPAAAEPRLGMIVPLLAMRRWTEAEQQARQVLRTDPGCFWASYYLVESLLGTARWRDANDVSRVLAERYPGDATVLEQAVRCRTAAGDATLAEAATRLAILKLAVSR